MRGIRNLLFFLIFSGSMQAQGVLSEVPKKEAFFGHSGKTRFCSMASDGQGGVLLAGQTPKGVNGGQDIYLVRVDKDWNKQAERYLGRGKDDGAHQVIARPNGGFLLVGYSEQPNRGSTKARYLGGRDGWLLWINQDGQSQTELILGTSKDDELTDALPLPDGGWMVVGHSDGRAWAVRLGASKQVLWQRYWAHPEGEAVIHAVQRLADRCYLVGRVGPAGNSRGWILSISLAGDRLSDKVFPMETLSEGHDITGFGSQQLAVVGEAYTRKNRLQGAWLLLDNQLQLAKVQHFGGRENDRFLTGALGYNGQWVLLGESHSYMRGAREPKAWAVELTSQGAFLQERYYGSKSFDSGQSILQRPNGQWWMAGQSNQKLLSGKQAWLWSAAATSRRKPLEAAFRFAPVVYANEKGIAGTGDIAAFIPIYVESDTVQLKPLQVRILHRESGQQWEQELVAGIGSNPVWYACPIPAPSTPKLGVEQFEIQLLQAGEQLGEPQVVEVQFSDPTDGSLSLQVEAVPGSFVPGRFGELDFTITNHSNQLISNIRLFGEGTSCLWMPDTSKIGALPAGSSLHYQTKLPVGNCQTETPQVLRFRVVDESQAFSALATIRIEIDQDEAAASVLSRPKARIITWLFPNPDQFDQEELIWNQAEIQVQVKVITSDSIRKQDFCLSINEQPCVSGVKFDEVQMSGVGQSRTFVQTIPLVEGENRLQAIWAGATDTLRTEPLKVVYTESRPNLHLLSIGVPSYDLEFTAQDARDFAHLFQANTGAMPAFQYTFIDTLTTEQQTTKTAILKSLRRIQYRSANQQIRPNDVVILFISSHGLSTASGQFRIAASDYDNPFLEETSLDFETEIMDYLKAIPCRKLIFIDACHSGAAGKEGDAGLEASTTTLAALAARTQGIDLLLSCRAEEYSYEDKRWENGAFTEALVRSVELFRMQSGSLDKNKDQQLSLQEWYALLGEEVQRLLAQKRPRPRSSQQPILYLATPGQDINLLKIKP